MKLFWPEEGATIEDCSFTSNSASIGQGGALAVLQTVTSDVAIDLVSAANAFSDQSGSAVIKFLRTVFIGNTVTHYAMIPCSCSNLLFSVLQQLVAYYTSRSSV